MAAIGQIRRGARVQGLVPQEAVKVVTVTAIGAEALEVAFERQDGGFGSRVLFAADCAALRVVEARRRWSFAAEGGLFKLALEAQRIRLAYLFDPFLAVTTSQVEPLPHQITAVYGEMLQHQPLRFLLADDPGAGKTIMAGLLIKELAIRGDLRRCLIVAPGGLVEQWQDELAEKFGLRFDILGRERIEAAQSGNPFVEADRWIVRLDQLSRGEDLQEKLKASPEFDLVVCDEAHRMSASWFAFEVRYTKRYQLGRVLGRHCRHFLLMSATPHNGKEADFQLFMALLDSDRFEGRFRDGVHVSDAGDLMRRLTKEELLKFDGRPLFPERVANTVKYKLSDDEAALYAAVTDYVRDEMDRAEQIEDGDEKRKRNVGFALQILQRRLASSPAAIHESLKRRLRRLEERLEERRLRRRGGKAPHEGAQTRLPAWIEDPDAFDEAPVAEVEAAEEAILDHATAARTTAELEGEIGTLKRLERQAADLRRSGRDTKWLELSKILDADIMRGPEGNRRKLIVFTEPKDTLEYLAERVRGRIGRPEAVVIIHGGIGREERRRVTEAFRNDPQVSVLVANDAAGEGVNLQRAHLMVNYDLPWNPNRLEQRFGRIHRIGQTEVCHLWNLVAHETREGQVYARLLEKLDTARAALGGRVFDVLGRLFEAEPLRDLLVKAIRYGEDPNIRRRLFEVVDGAVDQRHLLQLLEERALVQGAMDTGKVRAVRDAMERANARRLQPHYVRAFFLQAFERLGGRLHRREAGRFEISHVPTSIRSRPGTREPVVPRYERVCFDKAQIEGPPPASFVCPGHPLLDATLDLVREHHGGLLKEGAVLVAPDGDVPEPRLLLMLRHALQDGRPTRDGGQRVVSERVQNVELFADGRTRDAGPAPHLDCRPIKDDERGAVEDLMREPWLDGDLERTARDFAIRELVPRHLDEVRARVKKRADKVEAEVTARLKREILYWDHRALDLREREKAGKPPANLSAENARRRADTLSERLKARLNELALERQVGALPPVLIGAALIVPEAWLLARRGGTSPTFTADAGARAEVERLAMAAVMDAERALGHAPIDVSARNVGYDVESRDEDTGSLRLIEVKGRAAGAETVTITRNEILSALNAPEGYILALVEVEDGRAKPPVYVRRPFAKEPDGLASSVNYPLAKLAALGGPPS